MLAQRPPQRASKRIIPSLRLEPHDSPATRRLDLRRFQNLNLRGLEVPDLMSYHDLEWDCTQNDKSPYCSRGAAGQCTVKWSVPGSNR
jgi:hypothetical protein